MDGTCGSPRSGCGGDQSSGNQLMLGVLARAFFSYSWSVVWYESSARSIPRSSASIQLEFLLGRRRPFIAPGVDKQPEEIRVEMIPDTENVCQSSEAAVRSGNEAGYHQEKMRSEAEKEAASVTAWKRYQQLVAAVESRGGNFNRKLMLEAIFRGNDLVYASH